MDQSRFDRLAQSLVDPRLRSRRGVLATLGVAILGALLGADPDEADATKKRRRRPNHTKRHHTRQRARKQARQRQEDGRGRQRTAAQKKRGKKPKGREPNHGGGTDAPPSPPPGSPPPPPNPPPCVPECAAIRPCGDDGCNGSCGTCAGNETCDDGTCVCIPNNTAACAGRDCGDVINNCNQIVSCGGPCPTPPERCPDGAVTCGSDCFPACCPGATAPCYSGPAGTKNVGVCQAGVMQCTNHGTWGPCAGEVTPSTESCDGLDNDCDGSVDNGFDLQSDSNHCGSCGHVCPEGTVCQGGVCKAVCDAEFTCDCSNLNNCSGHGCCTEFCSCRCDEGWTGVECSIPTNQKTCADFATCGECFEYLSEGCVWCDQTLDGITSGLCVAADKCLSPREIC